MSEKIITLSEHRPPVRYTISISQHWDDTLEVFVEDIAGDERSLKSVANALTRAAEMFAAKASGAPSKGAEQ